MNCRKIVIGSTGISIGVTLAMVIASLTSSLALADFGFKGVTSSFVKSNGAVETRAGAHPYAYSLNFAVNQDGEGNPEGGLRELFVDLPPGVIGNPMAVPRCSGQKFEGAVPVCPGNTQVGVVVAEIPGLPAVTAPVYNLVPRKGVPVTLGASIFEVNSFQEASLRTGTDYGATVSDITFPSKAQLRTVKETIWGVPADPSHDSERVCINPDGTLNHEDCESDAGEVPFLTLPTSCTGPLKTTVRADSVQEPDVLQSKSILSVGNTGLPVGLDSCEAPPFKPSVTVRPETAAADSPSGLHVNINIPQNQIPDGRAAAHLKDTVVSLPAGLAVNPSSGNGLGACSATQIGFLGSQGGRNLFTPAAAQCPDDSKVGTVEVDTPLLDHPVKGYVYLARQGENPFGSLLALYIAIDDPITGVVIKLPGRVDADPLTGQLRAVFKDNPQLPFEDFDVDFFGGPRATLTTPTTCGKYATTTDMTPWTAPEGADAFPSDSFDIVTGAKGGPCVATEAEAPNQPSFEAGTMTPIAGSYSPFILRLSRENGSQRIAAIDTTLPNGLVGKLAGVPYCSDAQIAAAAARNGLGQGALEKDSPSCPLASEVGVVTVGAGSGSPLYVQGHAYLAGSYKGAPLSLVIITPAVAGPFDLGNVVVRTALYVNSETTQIHAVSDPLPTIIQGIPLDIRSIALNMSKPNFTLNPTSCEPKQIDGSVTSTLGNLARLSSRFQVGACAALGFKPDLKLNLKGGTKRGKFPALTATVNYPEGAYANISRVQVALPHSEFLAQNHIRTVCTRVQFAVGACPPGSVYGKARAITPLLDKPLEGPVYLRSSSHKLPDLVADLNGQIHVVLAGRVDSVKGGIRSTFEAVPDAPVSKFVLEMQGGKKGLLVNSTNICKSANKATVKLDAHNGESYDTTPVVGNSCKKPKAKKKNRGSR